MTLPRAVIVGGGQGGVGVAQALHGKAEVTLVDRCAAMGHQSSLFCPRLPSLPSPPHRDACVSRVAGVARGKEGRAGPLQPFCGHTIPHT